MTLKNPANMNKKQLKINIKIYLSTARTLTKKKKAPKSAPFKTKTLEIPFTKHLNYPPHTLTPNTTLNKHHQIQQKCMQ